MRPLSSPVHDHRVLGRAEAILGMFFIIVAATITPIDAVIGLFVMTPLLAAVLYLATFRPGARRAVRDAAPAPPGEREEPGTYLRRIRWPLAAQFVVFLVFGATARAPGLLGGIALGIGVALLLTARWLDRWEVENDLALLREPRGRGRRGAGARGYYVAGPGKTRTPRIANGA